MNNSVAARKVRELVENILTDNDKWEVSYTIEIDTTRHHEPPTDALEPSKVTSITIKRVKS